MSILTNLIIFNNMPKWTLASSFAINTNLLETNLINLIVVIGVLFYFGKGVRA
jgi:F-type H+-transporting ATPase subunit b